MEHLLCVIVLDFTLVSWLKAATELLRHFRESRDRIIKNEWTLLNVNHTNNYETKYTKRFKTANSQIWKYVLLGQNTKRKGNCSVYFQTDPHIQQQQKPEWLLLPISWIGKHQTPSLLYGSNLSFPRRNWAEEIFCKLTSFLKVFIISPFPFWNTTSPVSKVVQ